MLESVSGFANLAGATGMRLMFNSCKALTSLDLRGFSLGDAPDLYEAFAGCTALTTITADAGWWLPDDPASGYATFYNCTSLVGGNGTAYSRDRISADYMVVDTETTVGYLTAG